MTCQNSLTHLLKNGYQIASSGTFTSLRTLSLGGAPLTFSNSMNTSTLQDIPDLERLSLGRQPNERAPVMALHDRSALVSAEKLGETP